MTDYRQAGVDIEAGSEFVRRITPLVRSTFRPEVLTDLGGFGGLFRFQADRYKDPVLVSGTDGVGTKLKIAYLMDRHDTVGIDLVAMCVNDVAVSGAEPLFFLDYLATGKLAVPKAEAVIRGIADGCRQAGCPLIGGGAAEHPITGIAHTPGGGLTEILPGIRPAGSQAGVHRDAWPIPPICKLIMKIGRVEEEEMYRVFNMGIGLVLATQAGHADRLIARAAELGDRGYRIGEIVAGEKRVEYVGAGSNK